MFHPPLFCHHRWRLVIIIFATCCFASLPPTSLVSGSPFEAAFASSPYARGCPESYKKFEIMSGYAFSSAADSFASIPGCLELSSCLSACRFNDSCLAVNFETGLCVLLSSSAQHKPQALKESQFPVFTIYAHKVCLSDYGKCAHTRRKRITSTGDSKDWVTWVYERVPGHQLALVESNNPSASTTNLPIDSIAFASTMASNYFQPLPSSPTAPLATHTTGDSPSPNPWSSNSGLSDDFASFAYSSSSPSTASFASSSSSSSISSQVLPTQSTSASGAPLPLNNGLNSAFADDAASSILDASHSNMESGNYFFDSTARSKDADILQQQQQHSHPSASPPASPTATASHPHSNNNGPSNGGGGKYNKPRYLDVPSLGGLRNLQVLEVRVSSLLRCAEACLQETSFVCLSANFLRSAKRCTLMSFDRHTVAIDNEALKLPSQKKHTANIHRSNPILTVSPMYDYIEMNCRGKEQYEASNYPGDSETSPNKEPGGQLLCEFRPLSNVALKTVDAIFQDVSSINECKKKCLEAPFHCHSFDMGEDSSITLSGTTDTSVNDFASSGVGGVGDTNGDFLDGLALSPDFLGISPEEFRKKIAKLGNGRREKKSVCRISHLDRASLSHLKDPYSHLPGVTTYERSNCFNIKVTCGRDNMKAFFSSNKPFTGKIYSTKAASTCTQTLNSKNYFSIEIPYFANGQMSRDPSFSSSSSSSSSSMKGSKNPMSSSSPYGGGPLNSPHSHSHVSSLNPPYQSGISGKYSNGGVNSGSKYRSNSRVQRHSDCGVTSSNIRAGRREGNSAINSNLTDSDSHQVSSSSSTSTSNRTSRGLVSHTKDSTLINNNLFVRFSVSLVLQKHALIVTSSDFDVTLNCDYDLSQQRIISNSIQLISHSALDDWNALEDASANRKKPPSSPSFIGNQIAPGSSVTSATPPKVPPILPTGTGIGSVHPADPADPLAGMSHDPATFHSPVVRMSITDRSGGPVRAAEVGDPLSLRFEIHSEDGRENMYDVFVKSIFADDGADISELELIDSKGCPTDPAIMGPPRRVKSHMAKGSKIIEAPFEAFKFPTSAIVQFRALIVPCLTGDCQPVLCTLPSSALSSSNLAGYPTFASGSKATVHSFGKRSVDAHSSQRKRQRSKKSMPVTDMVIPLKLDNQTADLKELEERVYIEILDKRNDQSTQSQQPGGGELGEQSNIDDITAMQGKLNYDSSKPIEKTKVDNEWFLSRIPLPWIICCVCLMAIQLIALSRYYCGTRITRPSKLTSFMATSTAPSSSSSPLPFIHPLHPPTRISSVD